MRTQPSAPPHAERATARWRPTRNCDNRESLHAVQVSNASHLQNRFGAANTKRKRKDLSNGFEIQPGHRGERGCLISTCHQYGVPRSPGMMQHDPV